MKSILPAIRRARRFHLAAVLAGAVGLSPALAQAGAAASPADTRAEQRKAGASTPGTAAAKPSTPTTATGSGYHSGVASADADATREINAQNARQLPVERLTGADRRFLIKASDAGFAELQAAQLAAERAADPKVRDLAAKLVQAHSASSTELVTLGNQKGVIIEKDVSAGRAYNRLNRKKGPDFDQEFLEYIADSHEEAVKLFEKAATGANDTEVKSFAASHVAALRQHLQETQALQKSVSLSGPAAAKSERRAGAAPAGPAPKSDAKR